MPQRVLARYPWPGNVRELQNVIRRACLLATGALISAATLNLPAARLRCWPRSRNWTARASSRRLSAPAGVIAHAARDLGLSRQALYRRMERLGLKSRSPPARAAAVMRRWSLAGRVAAALAVSALVAAAATALAGRWLSGAAAVLAGLR